MVSTGLRQADAPEEAPVALDGRPSSPHMEAHFEISMAFMVLVVSASCIPPGAKHSIRRQAHDIMIQDVTHNGSSHSIVAHFRSLIQAVPKPLQHGRGHIEARHGLWSIARECGFELALQLQLPCVRAAWMEMFLHVATSRCLLAKAITYPSELGDSQRPKVPRSPSMAWSVLIQQLLGPSPNNLDWAYWGWRDGRN